MGSILQRASLSYQFCQRMIELTRPVDRRTRAALAS